MKPAPGAAGAAGARGSGAEKIELGIGDVAQPGKALENWAGGAGGQVVWRSSLAFCITFD